MNSKYKAVISAQAFAEKILTNKTKMQKNIEDYLRDNKGESGEFRLKVMDCSDSHLIIYINPVDRDGESFDGYVVLEMVQEKSKTENIFEEIRKNVMKSLHNNSKDGEVF